MEAPEVELHYSPNNSLLSQCSAFFIQLAKPDEDVFKPGNKTGGSSGEIFLISLVAPAVSLLMFVFCDMLVKSEKQRDVLHAYCVSVIMVIVFTVCSNYIGIIMFIIMVCFVVMMYTLWKFNCCSPTFRGKSWLRSVQETWDHVMSIELEIQSHSMPYLTAYRGHALLATAISILAVDFSIYPSRFSKTESYGWSVMDVGVGSFVAIHGMCSSQAKGRYVGSLKRAASSSAPLLILGFARLAAVTAVGYHQSVSEYGVHWNFFFTLGLTKMLCSTVCYYLPFLNSTWVAFGLGCLHQWLLSSQGLSEFILKEERRNLLEANKEGLLSVPGFVVIYMAGVTLGKYLLRPRCKMKEYKTMLCELAGFGICGWIVMAIMHSSVQQVSRRMCNLSYCVWIMALTALQIAVHMLEQIGVMMYYRLSVNSCNKSSLKTPALWEALNYNGLFYFLLANVFTGVVNMTVETSESSVHSSMLVLTVYISVLCLVALKLKQYSICLKP